MSQYEDQEDVFESASNYLSPKKSPPSRQTVGSRRSTASLRGSSLAHAVDDDAATSRFSLAHELAVALMPEPSAGSRLLAEEFGIEYDEGAEGIDDEGTNDHQDVLVAVGEDIEDTHISANESAVLEATFDADSTHHLSDPQFRGQDDDESPSGTMFGSPATPTQQTRPDKDPMQVLAQDLESTDNFLSQLRTLDVERGPSGSHQPALEKMASDVIRRLNETARDREGQVRELLEYEREFRRIAGEVGGSDVLAQLDEWTHEEFFQEEPSETTAPHLNALEEEPSSNDWEVDPDRHFIGDEDGSDVATPVKDSFPHPPLIHGPPTAAQTIPQLTHLRTFTTSLVASLTTISEQAQVNGAATTEAGRKIRALKNKLGGWRTDWDSAERSREKIERWEAGIPDGNESSVDVSKITGAKRMDGRLLVQEHLSAFEVALADAGVKTTSIMAS